MKLYQFNFEFQFISALFEVPKKMKESSCFFQNHFGQNQTTHTKKKDKK